MLAPYVIVFDDTILSTKVSIAQLSQTCSCATGVVGTTQAQQARAQRLVLIRYLSQKHSIYILSKVGFPVTTVTPDNCHCSRPLADDLSASYGKSLSFALSRFLFCAEVHKKASSLHYSHGGTARSIVDSFFEHVYARGLVACFCGLYSVTYNS